MASSTMGARTFLCGDGATGSLRLAPKCSAGSGCWWCPATTRVAEAIVVCGSVVNRAATPLATVMVAWQTREVLTRLGFTNTVTRRMSPARVIAVAPKLLLRRGTPWCPVV